LSDEIDDPWQLDADPAFDTARCPECGCDLECDEHGFDCSYGDDELNDDDF